MTNETIYETDTLRPARILRQELLLMAFVMTRLVLEKIIMSVFEPMALRLGKFVEDNKNDLRR